MQRDACWRLRDCPRAYETLYAFTVFCIVYRQRAQGKERHPDWIRSSPARGELQFECGLWDERPWRVVMRAALVGPDGETYVLPVLDRARIVRIRGKGILIEGTEVIPVRPSGGIKNVKVDRYRQAWWCVPKSKP